MFYDTSVSNKKRCCNKLIEKQYTFLELTNAYFFMKKLSLLSTNSIVY